MSSKTFKILLAVLIVTLLVAIADLVLAGIALYHADHYTPPPIKINIPNEDRGDTA